MHGMPPGPHGPLLDLLGAVPDRLAGWWVVGRVVSAAGHLLLQACRRPRGRLRPCASMKSQCMYCPTSASGKGPRPVLPGTGASTVLQRYCSGTAPARPPARPPTRAMKASPSPFLSASTSPQ